MAAAMAANCELPFTKWFMLVFRVFRSPILIIRGQPRPARASTQGRRRFAYLAPGPLCLVTAAPHSFLRRRTESMDYMAMLQGQPITPKEINPLLEDPEKK